MNPIWQNSQFILKPLWSVNLITTVSRSPSTRLLYNKGAKPPARKTVNSRQLSLWRKEKKKDACPVCCSSRYRSKIFPFARIYLLFSSPSLSQEQQAATGRKGSHMDARTKSLSRRLRQPHTVWHVSVWITWFCQSALEWRVLAARLKHEAQPDTLCVSESTGKK